MTKGVEHEVSDVFHCFEFATLHVYRNFAPTLDAPLDKKSFRLVIIPFHYRCLNDITELLIAIAAVIIRIPESTPEKFNLRGEKDIFDLSLVGCFSSSEA